MSIALMCYTPATGRAARWEKLDGLPLRCTHATTYDFDEIEAADDPRVTQALERYRRWPDYRDAIPFRDPRAGRRP